jgi:hypothetical protein
MSGGQDWAQTLIAKTGIPSMIDAEREQINHDYTDEIVCPYCGHVDCDSWEFLDGNEGDSVSDCGKCGKTFHCSRHISITYSTRRFPNDQDN